MIGWLSGVIGQKFSDRVIINTSGVGYEVYLPAPALISVGTPGDPIELYIHTHVREDAISLFGFRTLAERELFLKLTSVSGVGAKTAMNILAALPLDRLVHAIRARDTALLQRTPGIGKKTAERLVVELSDKLKDFYPAGDERSKTPTRHPTSAAEEVVSALLNLGYKQPEAESAVSHIDVTKFTSFDRILKETLKVLAK